MIDKLHVSFFERIPSLAELIIVTCIIGASVILGLIFKRLILIQLLKFTSRTKWQGDDIAINASKNSIPVLFFLAGIYFSIYILPLTPKVLSFLLVATKLIAILIVTLVIGRMGTGWINFYQKKSESTFPKSSILEYLIKTVIFIIGGLFMLQTMGISIAPLITALGVGGLAVALALQDTLSNLFAGLQILAAKNIQPGDYIRIETRDEGFIQDINWRTTTIKTLSNAIVIIPNAKLAGFVVTNFTKPDKENAILVNVGVSYRSNLDKVEQVTVEVAKSIMKEITGGVKEFVPFIRYNKLDAYSINFTVIMRGMDFTDQFLVTHEFIKLLHKRYREEGIEIPFPITTVLMPEQQKTQTP
ncbi:MAG TPA: mechanosensitive ion channel family protein [Bacteroidales bacterium]|nr:mechanosensitive ion channel family protein [Bacteroidales bacterium]